MIIAQSTVNKILDTLTVNDYFNIIQVIIVFFAKPENIANIIWEKIHEGNRRKILIAFSISF